MKAGAGVASGDPKTHMSHQNHNPQSPRAAYIKYTYTGIALNELSGLRYTCLPSELRPNGQCPTATGEQVIDRLGLDYITRDQAAGILVLFIVVSRFIGYLGLRYIKW